MTSSGKKQKNTQKHKTCGIFVFGSRLLRMSYSIKFNAKKHCHNKKKYLPKSLLFTFLVQKKLRK